MGEAFDNGVFDVGSVIIYDFDEFVGFAFRPAVRGDEKPKAKRAKRAVGGGQPKRADCTVGGAKAKRADCALGGAENEPPNVQPNEHCCALYIEPTSLEPNLSIESQSTNARARGDHALALLRGAIGLSTFNAWFASAVLTVPDGADEPAELRLQKHFQATHIRQTFGARLEELLGRRIEYAAIEGPKSGAAAHGVRVIGNGKAGRQGG